MKITIKNNYKVRGGLVAIELKRRTGDSVWAKCSLNDFKTKVGCIGTGRWQVRWSSSAQTFYAQYRTAKNPTKFCQMHRLVMDIEVVSWKVAVVNHKNFNGLDNRRANLEITSKQFNHHYNRKAVHNTSGYPNVTWDKKRNTWQAGFNYTDKGRKRYKHVGYFSDPEQAYRKVVDVKTSFMQGIKEAVRRFV